MVIVMKIKKGDIVGRISYGKDVFFIVDNVLKIFNKKEKTEKKMLFFAGKCFFCL